MPRAKQKSDVGTAMARLQRRPVRARVRRAHHPRIRIGRGVAEAPRGADRRLCARRRARDHARRAHRHAGLEAEAACSLRERSTAPHPSSACPRTSSGRSLTAPCPAPSRTPTSASKRSNAACGCSMGWRAPRRSTEIFDDDVDAIFEALIDDDDAAAKLLERRYPASKAVSRASAAGPPGLRFA